MIKLHIRYVYKNIAQDCGKDHLKGLKAFKEDFPQALAIVVSLDKYPGVMNDVEIFPAEMFLKALWNSEII